MPPGMSHKPTVTAAGEIFFPQSRSLGIDPVEFSPALQQTITYAGVTARSFNHASDLLDKIGGLYVDPKQVERLTRKVGEQRLAERDAATTAWRDLPVPQKFGVPPAVTPPELAVVQCDGGRLQIRDRPTATAKPPTVPSAAPPAAVLVTPPTATVALAEGPSAPLAAAVAETTVDAARLQAEEFEEEPSKLRHWREDRIGLLLRMDSQPSANAPCPNVPRGHLAQTHSAEVGRRAGPGARGEPTEEASAATDAGSDAAATAATRGDAATAGVVYQPPKVVERQVVATCQRWNAFAPMLAASAWSLGFMGATRKAFIGDGAANNWRLHKKFFSSFVAVLDFIHALSYVYAAAMAERSVAEGWACYRRWIEWTWQGRVSAVIEELGMRQAQLGEAAEEEPETSPRRVVAKALGYLRNQAERMHYDEYRRQGLPITSSLMESVVKQMNQRVKGTEKFWSTGGGEVIVQLRADQLSDGDPLDAFWQRRQETATGQRPYRRRAG